MTCTQYIFSQGVEKLCNRIIPINGYTAINKTRDSPLQTITIHLKDDYNLETSLSIVLPSLSTKL